MDGVRQTFKEYAAVDAVSSSRLRALARSPAYCRMVRDAPPTPTRAMRLGSALHARVLEPERFAMVYKQQMNDGRTTKGREERDAAARDGIELLDPGDWEAVDAMAISLKTHPRFAALMERAAAIEESVYWERDGRACKARRDMVGDGWILEIKTTTELSRFRWQVSDLAYDVQAAWYRIAGESQGRPAPAFFFAVVASTAPLESCLLLLDDPWDEGRRKAIALFDLFVKCELAGSWPAHIEALGSVAVRTPIEREETWRTEF